MMRVAPSAIVSFPNFGHWRHRLSLLARGRMPTSRVLPYTWYDTPNIHLCTIRDFADLARAEGVEVTQTIPLDVRGGSATGLGARRANMFAAGVVHRLMRRG
jgi:methionine biosynthesis protein MetW